MGSESQLYLHGYVNVIGLGPFHTETSYFEINFEILLEF